MRDGKKYCSYYLEQLRRHWYNNSVSVLVVWYRRFCFPQEHAETAASLDEWLDEYQMQYNAAGFVAGI